MHSFPDFVVFFPVFKPVCFVEFFLTDIVAAVNKNGCYNCSDDKYDIFITHEHSPKENNCSHFVTRIMPDVNITIILFSFFQLNLDIL